MQNVGQDGILRGGWQPPLPESREIRKADGALWARPQVDNPPHRASGSKLQSELQGKLQ